MLVFAALLYAGDELWARYRGRPTEQLKIDHVYTELNHFNELEYSAGKESVETCVDALLPHFGDPPCWYLRRHTLQRIGD